MRGKKVVLKMCSHEGKHNEPLWSINRSLAEDSRVLRSTFPSPSHSSTRTVYGEHNVVRAEARLWQAKQELRKVRSMIDRPTSPS